MDPSRWKEGVHPGMNGKVITEFIFIRHAESTSNASLTSGGGPIARDVPLTERGERQALVVRDLIKRLRGPNTRIYVSPLSRAMQTLGSEFDEDTVVVPELREWCRNDKGERVYESPDELMVRVSVALGQMRAPGRRVVAVGHSLWIAKCMQLMTMSNDKTMYHLSNASVTVIHETEWGVEVQAVGSVHHLPAELHTGHHTAALD